MICSPRQNLNTNVRLQLIPADVFTSAALSGFDYVPSLHPLICI